MEKHAAKGVKVIVSPIVGFRKPYLRMLGFSDGLLLERQLPWRSTPPGASRYIFHHDWTVFFINFRVGNFAREAVIMEKYAAKG